MSAAPLVEGPLDVKQVREDFPIFGTTMRGKPLVYLDTASSAQKPRAVIDAVSHLGVRHIDMPCTAERVWSAIAAAHDGDADPWREPPDIFATLPKGLEGDEDAAQAADGI